MPLLPEFLMKMESRMTTRVRLFFLLCFFMVMTWNIGCCQVAVELVAFQTNKILLDKPIAGYQKELLNIAFDVATMIPITPHIKDRSKAQALVVETSLELDQPQQALDFIEKIDNWRRGSGFADFAFYCVRNGYIENISKYLDQAAEISLATEDWRRDQIKVKIAKTQTLLGQVEQVGQLQEGLVESETGKVADAEAMMATEESFQKNIKTLDDLIAPGTFDISKNALFSYTTLYDRFYENQEHRSLIEEKIKTSWTNIPIFIRLDLMMNLIKSSLGHLDKENAIRFVNESQVIFDEFEWEPEYYIPLQAKLITLRFKAGDTQKTHEEADKVLAYFQENGEKIINIYRAETLTPLAETYHAIGDNDSALKVYKLALENAVENPNSRPQAEDLSETCLSLARNAMEPDAELWAQIRQIKEGLSDPW